MKMLKPVTHRPFHTRRRWKEVYDAVDKLKDGEWLPVVCQDKKEARNLYGAAGQRGYRPSINGTTVYVSKRQR